MADYKLIPGNAVQRVADGACIPFDAGNVDYMAYQKWLAAGGVPDPLPVVPTPPIIANRLYVKLELVARGLFATIDGAVQQSTDPALKIYWNEAHDFESDHPRVLAICKQLGIDDPTRLDIFNTARSKRIAGSA